MPLITRVTPSAASAEKIPTCPLICATALPLVAVNAASVLERAGHTRVTVLAGGPGDYAQAHDTMLVTGDQL